MLPDHSEVQIRISHLQRSLADSFNAGTLELSDSLAQELMLQVRTLQLIILDLKEKSYNV